MPKDLKFKGVEELLIFGFTYNRHKFKRTFCDVACTITQCDPANRSFDDLLEICQTYFPSTTPKKLAKTLEKLRTNEALCLLCLYCNDIEKLVFLCDGCVYEQGGSILEHELNIKGKGNYSYNDFINLVNG